MGRATEYCILLQRLKDKKTPGPEEVQNKFVYVDARREIDRLKRENRLKGEADNEVRVDLSGLFRGA